MSKPPGLKENAPPDLSGLAYILAFLIGVLLFVIFGEQLLGLKPNPIWIVFLMGISVSAIIFLVFGAMSDKEGTGD